MAGNNARATAHSPALPPSPSGNVAASARAREDRAIYRAAKILERRMRESGPLLKDPTLVRQWLQVNLSGRDREVFAGLFLDTQNRLIAWEELAHGSLAEASVYPREVVKVALKHNAGAVILAHNHPSGNVNPSEADRRLTDRLRSALAMIDVRVLDHFIVGGQLPAFSFAEKGLM